MPSGSVKWSPFLPVKTIIKARTLITNMKPNNKEVFTNYLQHPAKNNNNKFDKEEA